MATMCQNFMCVDSVSCETSNQWKSENQAIKKTGQTCEVQFLILVHVI